MWIMLFMSKILELFEIFWCKIWSWKKVLELVLCDWHNFSEIFSRDGKENLSPPCNLNHLFLMFSSSLYFQAIRNGRWFNSGQPTHSIINTPHSSAGLGSTARHARKLVCKHRFWYPVVPSELFTKPETHNRHRNSRKWKEMVVG